MIVQLNPASTWFPPAATALDEPNGLLAVGGDLSAERLISAYQNGIFPWFSQNDPILWWSPDPRALFLPGNLHVSRSLAKVSRQPGWQVTLNHRFIDVVRACADSRADKEGTWITEGMIEAYATLHELGHAHSVEVWFNGQLVGGLYGLSVGRAFCGESMFHYKSNASKIALLKFSEYFKAAGGDFIDGQIGNPHLFSLGAVNVPRDTFLMKLEQAKIRVMSPSFWSPQVITEASPCSLD